MMIAPEPASGVLHDLGYQPYQGTRLPQTRRFAVISKNVFAIAWRQKWGVRLPVLLTALVAIVGCVLIYVQRYATKLTGGGANPLLSADRVVLEVSAALGVMGFILGLRVGVLTIADDLRVGAFQFYFSRTIRPSDYLLGKLVGIGLVVGIPMLGAPLVLALFRLLLSDTFQEAAGTVRMLPAALIFGLAGTIAYGMPAAGCGALMQRRGAAMGMYAAFVFLGGGFIRSVAFAGKQPLLYALDPAMATFIVGQETFGVRMTGPPDLPPLWSAVVSLTAYALASIFIIHRRVARAETAGMGGG